LISLKDRATPGLVRVVGFGTLEEVLGFRFLAGHERDQKGHESGRFLFLGLKAPVSRSLDLEDVGEFHLAPFTPGNAGLEEVLSPSLAVAIAGR
jgi:hypothetical protein